MTSTKTILSEFTLLARQIDTKADSELLETMRKLEVSNIMSAGCLTNGDEFIPVGSCVDGSKINSPGDSGDIDVLILSNQIVLDESLFDYDVNHPAFLHIRVDGEHQKYFHGIAHPVHGKYLSASVLKQLHERFFCFGRLVVKGIKPDLVSNDGKFANVTRNSSVGFESNQLNSDPFLALGYQAHSNSLSLSTIGLAMIRDFEGEHTDMPVLRLSNKNSFDLRKQKITSPQRKTKFESSGHFQQVLEWIKLIEDDDLKEDNGRSTEIKSTNYTKEKKEISSNHDSMIRDDINNMLDLKQLESASLKRKTKVQKPADAEQLYFRKFKSVDFVPAFKFKGWPRSAEEWIYRKRMWPSKRTVREVLDAGCQVVAKSPRVLYTDDHACETDKTKVNKHWFRLSFALSEIAIAKEMSQQQKLCWRVLKAYHKSFFKAKPQVNTSYHWKNVVFWVFEEADQTYWVTSNVLEGVLRSLDFMIICLERKFLPFYFVRRMNLLHGYHEHLIDEVCSRVKMIRHSPIEYLKLFLRIPPRVEIIHLDKKTVEEIMSKEYEAEKCVQSHTSILKCFRKWYQTANPSNFCFMLTNTAQIERENLSESEAKEKVNGLLLTCVENIGKSFSQDYKNKRENIKFVLNNFVDIIKCTFGNKGLNNETEENKLAVSALDMFTEVSKMVNDEQYQTNTYERNFLSFMENTTAYLKKNAVAEDVKAEDVKAKNKANAFITLMDSWCTLAKQSVEYKRSRKAARSKRNKKKIEIVFDLD